MAAIEEGKVCVLRSGRRTGEEVEIVKLDGKSIVVKTKKGKERKVSIRQLDPKE